ncbi:hypothetical protein ACIRG5_47850 [Lentzea sp. NPDC102401]|uniref:hypothetical protein n=1 Tax=Lentzea sp. NPDC102401 TaxID=3364128 RepID=UPI0038120760
MPTAPKWTISDLVANVGQTQHGIAEIVERRITDSHTASVERSRERCQANVRGGNVRFCR